MYAILEGLRMVEASAFVAAPTGGLTLAQLGADVIRVDPVGGGVDVRRWPLAGSALAGSGASIYWASLKMHTMNLARTVPSPRASSVNSCRIPAPAPCWPVPWWKDCRRAAAGKATEVSR